MYVRGEIYLRFSRVQAIDSAFPFIVFPHQRNRSGFKFNDASNENALEEKKKNAM